VSGESALEGWHRFIGSWEIEGAHPTLPGEAVRGTSTFEWLGGRRFVIWRSQYGHAQIPDAITIIGVTDRQLSMHYFDERGVYGGGTWEDDLALDFGRAASAERVVNDERPGGAHYPARPTA
jgi:hypothetical protein